MTTRDYTFELLEVIEDQNQMMVKFSSPGREDIIVGTPLPTEGMDLKDFLHHYVPMSHWIEKERKVFVPEVGTTGEYIHEVEMQKLKEADEAAMTQALIHNVEPTLSEEQIKELIEQLKK